MELARFAYAQLVEVARVDGELVPGERALLERYRLALELPAAEAERVEREGAAFDPARLAEVSAAERVHVVQMMLALAFADGRVRRRERRRVRHVAHELGVGPFQLAALILEAERHRLQEDRGRRALLGVVLVGLMAGVGLALVALRGGGEPDHAAFAAPLAGSDVHVAFQAAERTHREALVLIAVTYDLVHERSGRRRGRRATGTGFLVTPDGLGVTNKHVLQPWKFAPDVVWLLEQGYQPDPASVELAAWGAGTTAYDDEGELDFAGAWTSGAKSFRIVALAPDELEVRPAQLADGSSVALSLHTTGDLDLALFSLALDQPAPAFRLRCDAQRVQTLEPVVVLGFPGGAPMHEGRLALPSGSLGEVRKVENSIFISAPIVPGNSGGPVLGLDGRVIGIASRQVGDATVGACIRSERVLPYLPEAEELARSARAHSEGGRADAARCYAELALQREPRGRLLKELEELLRAGGASPGR